jgi:hypothetical protein
MIARSRDSRAEKRPPGVQVDPELRHSVRGVTDDVSAAERYEVVKIPASRVRRRLTSILSLVSLSSPSTLPQWSRYEIRDRKTGAVLRTINDVVDGRGVEPDFEQDLAKLTATEFAQRWEL